MQPAASSTNNHPYLFADAIRAWAILLVVVLHLAAAPVTRFSLLDPQDWWIMNIFDSFARPAVALFIMVSGLFLLDPRRREGLASFNRKRVSRIAWPFIGWAIVYLAWRMIYHGEAIAWTNLLRELVQGPVYVHFWFMYMLVGLYLVTPILRVVVRNAEQNVLWYSIALWFTFASVMPMVDRGAGTGLGVYMNVLGFAGYYMLGYMLRDIVLTSGQRVWMLLLLAVMTTVTAVGSFVLTASNNGVFDELFYRNASPNVVLMSVAMFMLLTTFHMSVWLNAGKGPVG